MARTARGRHERGQSLVEFALILPLFLLLIIGVIDGGRLVFASNHTSQVVRAVARVASTTCFRTPIPCDMTSGPLAEAIVSQRSGFQGPPIWTVTCLNPTTQAAPTNTGSDFCRVGYLVKVTVSSAFRLAVPIASSLGAIPVGSQTQQEILE